MKKIKLFLIFFLISNIIIAQNRFNTPIITEHTQTYESQYVPIDYQAIQNALDRKQAIYDKNKEYIDNIINWIFEMKKQTNDKDFIMAIDYYYYKLRELDNADLSQYSNYIRDIELSIKEEVEKYNTRLKQANDPKVLWDKGIENYKNKNYKIAIENFSKVIETNPNFEEAYRYRGLSNIQIENYIIAINDFNKLIELNPNLANNYLLRGIVKSKLNDISGAIKDNKKAIELNPNFSMAYNNLAWDYFKLKKYNEALIFANKAISLDNSNDIAYDSRAEINFYLNNYKESILDSKKAIELNPKCSNSYLIMGRAQYRLGFKSNACESWSSAGDLGKIEAYEYISKYCNN